MKNQKKILTYLEEEEYLNKELQLVEESNARILTEEQDIQAILALSTNAFHSNESTEETTTIQEILA